MLNYKKRALFYIKEELHFCNFIVDKVVFDNDKEVLIPNGFSLPRIAYINSGECVCISEDCELHLKAGDIWSLPAKKRYKSIWTAKPKVDFYYVQYEADFISLSIKRFKKIDNCDLSKEFKTLYYSTNKFERLNMLYKIIFKLQPLISENEDLNIEVIEPALDYIRNNYAKTIKISHLASLCFLCESRFYSEFKKITGLTPIDYKNTLKMSKAVEMILNNLTLEEICEKLGYSSPSFLRRQMRKYLGKTPKELKKQNNLL